MIQPLTMLRRPAAVLAVFAMLSGLAPARARGDAHPAGQAPGSAPADSTAPPTPPQPAPAPPPAPTPVSGKKAKSQKPPKPPKGTKLTKEQKAAQEKAAKAKARADKAALEQARKAAKASASANVKGKGKTKGNGKAKPAATAAPAASDSTGQVAAAPKAKPEKPAKPPKPAKLKAPEKSMEERRKVDGIYAKGSNWMTFRFGYAKRSGDLTGDGLVGYGIAYQHMMSSKYGFAVGAGQDIVGHFQGQLDEAVPFTGEFQRHFKWSESLRPYVGVGGGYYLRKMYRTPGDYNTVSTAGGHFSLGFTSGLDPNHVIGFETRLAQVSGRKGIVNPTFGPGEDVESIWTAKVFWGLVY